MLLIDCGNSALKTRLLDSGEPQDHVFPFPDETTAGSFAGYLTSLSSGRVYASCVAAQTAHDELQSLIRLHLPQADYQRLVTPPELGGVHNGYRDYRQLGVDRWLTLLAAHALAPQGSIIIDAGSAITIDLLARNGDHLGGAILPGLNTSLQRFQSLFPGVDFAAPEIAATIEPGRSTAACINLDQLPVTVAGIEQILQRWLPLLDANHTLLLCGQDAPRIAEGISLPHRIVPDLVFLGMLQHIRCLG